MFVTCFKGMAMKKLAFILFVIVSATSLIGCNTVQGVGKDISKGGQAIEGLYYVGPMLRARYWEAIAVPELRVHAQQLVKRLLS